MENTKENLDFYIVVCKRVLKHQFFTRMFFSFLVFYGIVLILFYIVAGWAHLLSLIPFIPLLILTKFHNFRKRYWQNLFSDILSIKSENPLGFSTAYPLTPGNPRVSVAEHL